MNKFLTIGMIIVIMSLLSCGSGPIGVLAAAILPLFAIIGVGLMTLNVLVTNGQNQNLAGEPNDPAVVLGDFMDLIVVYGAKCARGLFFGIGKMIGWGMPDMIGAGAAQAPQPVPPPAGFAGGKGAGQSAEVPGRVKIKVHIYLHKHDKHRKKHAKRAVPIAKARRSRRSKTSVS